MVPCNQILTQFSWIRKNNSCESILQSILLNWKITLNNKLMIGALFRNFQRAFAIIARPKFTSSKLNILKIKVFSLIWCTIYLEGRSQLAKYGNVISSVKATVFSVSQGTVLRDNNLKPNINKIKIMV